MKLGTKGNRETFAKKLAVLVFVVFSAVGIAQSSEEVMETVVQVKGGKVRGVATNDLIVFKGIPFAQPPVGALRWRPPEPVQGWNGVRDASEFAPDPAQPPSSMLPNSTRTSEDCLYLNVWRPAGTNKELPVLVWIYGGGLVQGGASSYPGEFLARQGIVFVSFNYRLGRLGFFAHPALGRELPKEPRGNYGYMDQIAALKWVKKNIGYFGGDPKNVTIAGDSAGGGSVLVLVTSLMSRGLFQRAILESAIIPTSRPAIAPMRTMARAEAMAVEYATVAGIKGDDKSVLAALRALPVESLIKGTEDYDLSAMGGPDIQGLSHAIIDGKIVVDTPEGRFLAGRQAPVSVIVGANNYDMAVSPAQTKDDVFALFGSLASEARHLYDPKGDASFKEVHQAVFADYEMIEPSRHLAELVSRGGQPAYFYRFSYVGENMRDKTPGATHGSEIMYVLDALETSLKEKATNVDLEMARTVSNYWLAFIKTGNPNGGGRPDWLPYNPDKREVLNFTDSAVLFGADPLKERLDFVRTVWQAP